ncbi:hypothetical protein B0H11DRAFT_2097133 [Mycena galericulata]|nr:hypothetical protein B0H11DRAFT_2097133 [Mycena galericulata]
MLASTTFGRHPFRSGSQKFKCSWSSLGQPAAHFQFLKGHVVFCLSPSDYTMAKRNNVPAAEVSQTLCLFSPFCANNGRESTCSTKNATPCAPPFFLHRTPLLHFFLQPLSPPRKQHEVHDSSEDEILRGGPIAVGTNSLPVSFDGMQEGFILIFNHIVGWEAIFFPGVWFGVTFESVAFLPLSLLPLLGLLIKVYNEVQKVQTPAGVEWLQCRHRFYQWPQIRDADHEPSDDLKWDKGRRQCLLFLVVIIVVSVSGHLNKEQMRRKCLHQQITLSSVLNIVVVSTIEQGDLPFQCPNWQAKVGVFQDRRQRKVRSVQHHIWQEKLRVIQYGRIHGNAKSMCPDRWFNNGLKVGQD